MKNLQIFIWKSSYLYIWLGKSYNNETEVIFQDNWNKWQILNHRIDLQFFDTKLWLQYNNLKFLKNYHHFSLRHTYKHTSFAKLRLSVPKCATGLLNYNNFYYNVQFSPVWLVPHIICVIITFYVLPLLLLRIFHWIHEKVQRFMKWFRTQVKVWVDRVLYKIIIKI